MEVAFGEDDLQELENNPDAKSKLNKSVIKAYRERMRCIRDAVDERDLVNIKSFRFTKLGEGKQNQYSICLDEIWHLVIGLVLKENGNVIQILSIKKNQK